MAQNISTNFSCIALHIKHTHTDVQLLFHPTLECCLVFTCMHIYMCTYTWTHVNLHTYEHPYKNACVNEHAHIHTYKAGGGERTGVVTDYRSSVLWITFSFFCPLCLQNLLVMVSPGSFPSASNPVILVPCPGHLCQC